MKGRLAEAVQMLEEGANRATERIEGLKKKSRVPALRSPEMAEGEDKAVNEREPLSVVMARLRRERDQRLAELQAQVVEERVETDRALKELAEDQAEFRDRVMGDLRKALYG